MGRAPGQGSKAWQKWGGHVHQVATPLEGRLSELFLAVLCPTLAHSDMHRRVCPFPGARRQNQTDMFSVHDKVNLPITAATYRLSYFAPVGLRSIVMCVCVCVSVCPFAYLKNCMAELHQIFCACCMRL